MMPRPPPSKGRTCHSGRKRESSSSRKVIPQPGRCRNMSLRRGPACARISSNVIVERNRSRGPSGAKTGAVRTWRPNNGWVITRANTIHVLRDWHQEKSRHKRTTHAGTSRFKTGEYDWSGSGSEIRLSKPPRGAKSSRTTGGTS
jgi:hypothetical protein